MLDAVAAAAAEISAGILPLEQQAVYTIRSSGRSRVFHKKKTSWTAVALRQQPLEQQQRYIGYKPLEQRLKEKPLGEGSNQSPSSQRWQALTGRGYVCVTIHCGNWPRAGY